MPAEPPSSDLVASSNLDALLASLGGDGKDFELLCKWFLENDPFWAAVFRRVWLWPDWPGRWGRDHGIDLIGETHDDRVFAIQAKNYGVTHSITKSDVDKFLSESNRAVISERLLMASTDLVSNSASSVMAAQEKPVTTCLLENLHLSELSWPASAAELAPVDLPRFEPRPHQLEALEAIHGWAESGATRGQVIMACGTGKTLVSVWAADRLAARKVLVLVPRLALLRQSAAVWARHSRTDRHLLLVCGDQGPGELEDLTRGDELGNLRTTSPLEIQRRLESDDALLAVCTYNSSPALAKAMQNTASSFDLAVADEAHRCAGLETSSHKTIVDERAIRSERRLFFTATPTIYGTRDKGRAGDRNVALASMDDEAKFGRVIHHLSFAEATARELLCPYQVAVIPVHDEEVHRLIRTHRVVTADGDERLDAASLATQIACARAMRKFGCRRMVAFQPSIAESKRFSAQFPAAAELLAEDAPLGDIWSQHVDGGGMPPARRARILRRFRSDDPDENRVLSNVKLLAEGVDEPTIDAVAFIDTHRSQVSIIQAVGRAVRRTEGKSVGTIVLPVVLRHDEPLDVALARSEHRSIVDILGALRSHDPQIARSLDDLRFSYSDATRDRRPVRFVVDAPVQVGTEFADAVGLALASKLGVPAPRELRKRRDAADIQIVEVPREPNDEEKFEIGLDLLWSAGRLDLLPAVPEIRSGFPLGLWWAEAKKRWRADTLGRDDRRLIACCVSWLARDLAEEDAIRWEMAGLTDANLPEQVLAQLRAGGALASGPLGPLAAESRQLSEFLDAIRSVHRAVTNAAMPNNAQLNRLVRALEGLATALTKATEGLEPYDWEWESRRFAAAAGFAEAADARTSAAYREPEPPPSWRRQTEPDAYAIGVATASEIHDLIDDQLPFKFSGDHALVESRRDDEMSLRPDLRFDELGWDIFLLAYARAGYYTAAVEQAMNGNLHQRQLVREDLLRRWARESSLGGKPSIS